MSKPGRNYRLEYDQYHASPEQKKRRASRNAARATAEKAGKVSKGDGLEVHHKNAPRKGPLNNSKVAVVSKKYNRSMQPKRGGKK